MTFTVKYRTSNGSTAEKAVEAANRADCFAKCKAQGIVPIGVSNGDKVSAASKRQFRNGGSRGGKSLRWVIYAIVLVLAGGIAYFLMGGKSAPAKESAKAPTKPQEIESVKPAAAPKPAAVPEKPKAEKKPKPQRVGEIRDGYRLLCDGTLHKVQGVITNAPGKFSVADKTFKHSADVELGNLLMVEPGDDLLGDSAGMYKGFNKEFDEALSEPIEFSDDDTPMQREMKQAVKELREELKHRRAKGEDIEKIMEDTRNQLKELSLYRQELEDEVRKHSTEALTQKDYEDLVQAANQMLEERGIKPLEMPTTLRHAIRLRKVQENAAKKQKGNNDEIKK